MAKRQTPPAPLNWRVQLETTAVRQFKALEAEAQSRIAAAIDDLARDPRPAGAKKLAGTPGYRVRTGDWRILYTVNDPARLVRVYRIGNRRDVYRNL